MKILVVCAHLMNRMGVLNEESKGRCKIANELMRKHKYSKVIVPGWAYRSDSQITISSRMKHYLINKFHVNQNIIFEEPRSRDTVGDAIFCRLFLSEYLDQITDLTIVTSDYHVKRAIKIFQFVFGDKVLVNTFDSFCTDRPSSNSSNEITSFEKFEKTFSGVKSGDVKIILERLLSHHPFYNGEKHPKVYLSDCLSV